MKRRTFVGDLVTVRDIHWAGYPHGWLVQLRVERPMPQWYQGQEPHFLGMSAWLNPADLRALAKEFVAAAKRLEGKSRIAKVGQEEKLDWERRQERRSR